MLTEQNGYTLATLPTLNEEDHPLSAVHYLINNFESKGKIN
jgi:hypothetical protein